MAQSDLFIQNATNPEVRTDMNAAYAALASTNSGPTAPSVTYAGMLWWDTSTSPWTLRVRNSSDNGWIVAGTMSANLGFVSANNPTLTGNVTVGTLPVNTSDTRAASTAFVVNQIAQHAAWISISLFNGWTAFTPCQYRRLSSNITQLRGTASKSNPTAGEQVGSIGVGQAPTQSVSSPAVLFSPASNVPAASWQIDTGGLINYYNPNNTTGTAYIYFNGFIYG